MQVDANKIGDMQVGANKIGDMQADVNKYSGVTVAMNSCYDGNGAINPDAVRQLTRFLIDKGVRGLYVGGSTGEGVLQTVEERKIVLEAVVAEARGEATLIAHVGAITTDESVELAVHAGEAGVDAISSIAPFYFSYSEEAVKRHWLEMMDAVELPFIIYNFPGTTGFQVTGKLLKELLAHERLLGMKTTSLSVFELQQFKAVGGDSFLVFNGPDHQYLAGRVMGACGGIGGTYNVMPELFLKIEREYTSGNIAEAQKWQFAVNEIIADFHRFGGSLGAIKEIIRLRGIDCGKPRRPIPAISGDLYPRMLELHEKIESYVEQCSNR
jgi:N-acetylneuraminate lyase